MNTEQDKRLSQLMILAQQGHQGAYESLLHEVSAILRTFLLRRTRSPGELEDILQDTLLTLHRARHSYTPGRPIGPWIYAICENRIIDGARKRQRIQRIEEAWKTAHRDFTTTNNNPDSHAEEVLELMKKLPLRQKWIIGLLKLQGLSVADVATQTGLSESAVKVTAFRGYETLRKLLGIHKK